MAGGPWGGDPVADPELVRGQGVTDQRLLQPVAVLNVRKHKEISSGQDRDRDPGRSLLARSPIASGWCSCRCSSTKSSVAGVFSVSKLPVRCGPRGIIYDCRMNELARNVPSSTAIVSPAGSAT